MSPTVFIQIKGRGTRLFTNLPKLQQIYKTDRTPTLREILAKIFGVVPAIATRSELADETFEKFVISQEVSAIHSRELRTVFVAFLLIRLVASCSSEANSPVYEPAIQICTRHCPHFPRKNGMR
jgi:hypothetical protein